MVSSSIRSDLINLIPTKMRVQKTLLIPKNGKLHLEVVYQCIHYHAITSLAGKLNLLTHNTTPYEKHI